MANIVKNVTKAVSKADQGVDLAFGFISKNASVKRQARKMEQTMSTVKRGAGQIGSNQSVSVNRGASALGSSYKKTTTLKPGANTVSQAPMRSNAPVMVDRSTVGVAGKVKSNEAVNPTIGRSYGKVDRETVNRKRATYSEGKQTAQTQKAADQQAAKQVAQNEANRAGNESIKQSNEKITEMKSQAKAKFKGFLNDVNPKDVSDEYAYIANRRKQKAENNIAEMVNSGRITAEKGAQMSKELSSSSQIQMLNQKANAGNNSRMDLFNDLADSNAKMSGRTEANLVDKGAAAMEMAGSYFLSGDKSRNTKRIGTAVGAYGATAYGTRKLSGGDATYNSHGRRDIVGVPFF